MRRQSLDGLQPAAATVRFKAHTHRPGSSCVWRLCNSINTPLCPACCLLLRNTLLHVGDMRVAMAAAKYGQRALGLVPETRRMHAHALRHPTQADARPGGAGCALREAGSAANAGGRAEGHAGRDCAVSGQRPKEAGGHACAWPRLLRKFRICVGACQAGALPARVRPFSGSMLASAATLPHACASPVHLLPSEQSFRSRACAPAQARRPASQSQPPTAGWVSPAMLLLATWRVPQQARGAVGQPTELGSVGVRRQHLGAAKLVQEAL